MKNNFKNDWCLFQQEGPPPKKGEKGHYWGTKEETLSKLRPHSLRGLLEGLVLALQGRLLLLAPAKTATAVNPPVGWAPHGRPTRSGKKDPYTETHCAGTFCFANSSGKGTKP